MRRVTLLLLVAVVACDDGADVPKDSGVADAPIADAPGTMPMLTSFVPMPNTIPANTPTMITWNWSYAIEPTFPEPTCSIDNGVGAVTRGQATVVTLTAVTTFTLTCTNYAGTAQRNAVVAIPPTAPIIGSATAAPTGLMSGVPTSVTINWTYSNFPSPAPTCTLEGLGAVTPGGSVMVTLTTSRSYLLKCTNGSGSSTYVVTINVNECASGTHDCQSNATCVDNPNSYTCQCNTGYSGNGDVCSAQTACTAPSTGCDTNATCIGPVGSTACVCNPGYVGNGLTCTRLLYAFTTSATGNGNLSSWAGAGGATGLAAADAICQAAATSASLPGTYKAWMSDQTNDAYCRVAGYAGKKVNNCNLAVLPTAAGPWVRVGDKEPVAPTIDKLISPYRVTYRYASTNENGSEVTFSDNIYTGTLDDGSYSASTCLDWSSNSFSVRGTQGEIAGGGTSWTDAYSIQDPTCDTVGRLRCMEVSTAGGALPTRHAVTGKRAFVTSVSGTGQLSSWVDAQGLSGLAAADAICQSRARYAGFANPQTFKAWLAYYTSSISNRIASTATPYVRPDGIIIATSRADMTDARLNAPLYQNELGQYESGTADNTGGVWTGMTTSGAATSTTYSCNGWTYPYSSYTATSGRFDLADDRFVYASLNTISCATAQRLYCVEDQ